MASTFDISQIEKYRDDLLDIKLNMDDIIKRILNNIASRMLREVKRNTPVGDYSGNIAATYKRPNKKKNIKKGDFKRNKDGSIKMSKMRIINFTTKDGVEVSFTANMSGKQGGTLRRGWKIDGYSYSNGVYEVKVVNNTEYASYVEDGHRIVRNKATIGWVPGVFMMRISEDKIRAEIDNIVKLELKKVFGKI